MTRTNADLAAIRRELVTVHVGGAEPGTGTSWLTWSGVVRWAELAPVPEDAAVLVIPHDGPLGLLTSWAAYVEGQVTDGLWTGVTTDGIAVWVASTP